MAFEAEHSPTTLSKKSGFHSIRFVGEATARIHAQHTTKDVFSIGKINIGRITFSIPISEISVRGDMNRVGSS